MTSNPTPKKRGLPNPFFVLLLAASTCFVVTCFAYLISPTVLEQTADGPGADAQPSRRLAAWLDRSGPSALGVEFVVMLAAGVLAMATDRWFPSKPPRPAGPQPS